VLSVDSPASVTAAFQNAARCIERVVEQTRGEASIWDSRLQKHNISARLMSGSPMRQRGRSALRLTPSFGAKVEQYACAEPAVREGVRVVLAGVARSARICDARTGRTLVLHAALLFGEAVR